MALTMKLEKIPVVKKQGFHGQRPMETQKISSDEKRSKTHKKHDASTNRKQNEDFNPSQTKPLLLKIITKLMIVPDIPLPV